MIDVMDMEFFYIQMEKDMKVNGYKIKKVEMESITLQMVTYIQDNLEIINQTDKVNICIITEINI